MTRYAVPALIALLLGWVWWSDRTAYQTLQAEHDALAGRNLTLTQTATGRLAELQTERALTRQIGADLSSALAKLNAKPKTLIQTVIVARPETTTVALRDTIIGSTPQWTFSDRIGPYRASGSVWPETKKMTLAIERDPISMAVVVARTKAGNWLGVVNLPDSTLKVGTIDVQVVQPDQPGWLSRNRGKIGLVTGGIIGVLLKSL